MNNQTDVSAAVGRAAAAAPAGARRRRRRRRGARGAQRHAPSWSASPTCAPRGPHRGGVPGAEGEDPGPGVIGPLDHVYYWVARHGCRPWRSTATSWGSTLRAPRRQRVGGVRRGPGPPGPARLRGRGSRGGGAPRSSACDDLDAARWQLEQRGAAFDEHVGEVGASRGSPPSAIPTANALQLIEYRRLRPAVAVVGRPVCWPMDAQTCPRCGEPLPAGAQFCPNCGAPVSVPAASERRVGHRGLRRPGGLDRAGVPPGPRALPRGAGGVPRDGDRGDRVRSAAAPSRSSATPCSGCSACPSLHDDDAVRAIRAALAVVERAARLRRAARAPDAHAGAHRRQHRAGRRRHRRRPQPRDRRRGEHRRAAAAGGRARRGPGRARPPTSSPQARSSSARCA